MKMEIDLEAHHEALTTYRLAKDRCDRARATLRQVESARANAQYEMNTAADKLQAAESALAASVAKVMQAKLDEPREPELAAEACTVHESR